MRNKQRSILFVFFAAASVALCTASRADDLPVSSGTDQSDDPFENVNRASYDLSMFLDRNALRPVAEAYVDVVPEPARNGARNFLDNLNSPVIFVNNLLQGDGDAAGNTMTRFLINSTIGIGGLMNPAADLGYPADDEDFGITLGRWGVDAGPYLFVPVLGPSSPRDAVGYATDFAVEPLTYWRGSVWVPVGLTAVDIVDTRARNIESTDQIERTSIDGYAAVRSLYRQFREAKINKGESGVQKLPEY